MRIDFGIRNVEREFQLHENKELGNENVTSVNFERVFNFLLIEFKQNRYIR